MLLLVEENSLLQSLPMDSSPALMRIIKVASPVKSLQDLSSDADLPLGQVRKYFEQRLIMLQFFFQKSKVWVMNLLASLKSSLS